jgi:hypothetical protein
MCYLDPVELHATPHDDRITQEARLTADALAHRGAKGDSRGDILETFRAAADRITHNQTNHTQARSDFYDTTATILEECRDRKWTEFKRDGTITVAGTALTLGYSIPTLKHAVRTHNCNEQTAGTALTTSLGTITVASMARTYESWSDYRFLKFLAKEIRDESRNLPV